MVEDGRHPVEQIKIQESLIHGAEERWHSEDHARFMSVERIKLQ
jgi:hypothetical protein